MAIRALTFDNAENIESRNDAYWYSFISKSICGTSVGIIKYGSSMEPHQNANEITFDHGYVVIHGRLIEVDSETKLKIPFSNSDQTVTGSVIIRVDLQKLPGQQVFLTTKIGELKQDDLNTELSGMYEYEIGSYTANHNTITSYTDKRKYINSDLEKRVSDINTNYGVEKNKWAKTERNSGEFDKSKSPNNKWYMIITKEQFVFVDNFSGGDSQIKMVFFNWCDREARITNFDMGLGGDASWLGIRKDDGLGIAVTTGFVSWGDESQGLSEFIIAVYRWDGRGIPIIAGGSLII